MAAGLVPHHTEAARHLVFPPAAEGGTLGDREAIHLQDLHEPVIFGHGLGSGSPVVSAVGIAGIERVGRGGQVPLRNPPRGNDIGHRRIIRHGVR